MSTRVPDTRNKLDSNIGIKKKRPKNKSLTLKNLKNSFIPEVIRLKATRKESKGELFKARLGLSKSMAEAIRNAGGIDLIKYSFHPQEVADAVGEYKLLRKSRKKLIKKIQQDNRALSKVKRRSGKRATKSSSKKK
jgi:hypothetical protein